MTETRAAAAVALIFTCVPVGCQDDTPDSSGSGADEGPKDDPASDDVRTDDGDGDASRDDGGSEQGGADDAPESDDASAGDNEVDDRGVDDEVDDRGDDNEGSDGGNESGGDDAEDDDGSAPAEDDADSSVDLPVDDSPVGDQTPSEGWNLAGDGIALSSESFPGIEGIVAQQTGEYPALPDGLVLTSPVFEVLPHSVELDAPVTLFLETHALASALVTAGPEGVWSALPTDRSLEPLLATTVSHFSYFATVLCTEAALTVIPLDCPELTPPEQHVIDENVVSDSDGWLLSLDVSAAAVASDGFVYAAGSLDRPFYVGDTLLDPQTTVAEGKRGAYLARFGADGTPDWAQPVITDLGAGVVRPSAYLAPGPAGSVFIALEVPRDVQVMGQPLPASPSGSALALTLTIAKIDADGTLDWLHVVEPGTNARLEQSQGITATPDGGLLVGGSFDANPVDHGFLTLLSPTGEERWTMIASSSQLAGIGAAAVSVEGSSVRFTGGFRSSVEFVSGDTTLGPYAASSYTDAFVGSISISGELEWLSVLPSDPDILVAAGLHLVTAPGALTVSAGILSTGYFVVQHDGDGSVNWRQAGAGNSTSLALRADGVSLAGWFNSEVQFGDETLTRAGEEGAFVLSFDGLGMPVESRLFSRDGFRMPRMIYTDGSSLFVSGLAADESFPFAIDLTWSGFYFLREWL